MMPVWTKMTPVSKEALRPENKGEKAPEGMGVKSIKVGDKVKHRASGEIGIVTKIHTACAKHTTLQHTKMKGESLDCDFKLTGRVTISTGFTKAMELEQGVTVAYLIELETC